MFRINHDRAWSQKKKNLNQITGKSHVPSIHSAAVGPYLVALWSTTLTPSSTVQYQSKFDDATTDDGAGWCCEKVVQSTQRQKRTYLFRSFLRYDPGGIPMRQFNEAINLASCGAVGVVRMFRRSASIKPNEWNETVKETGMRWNCSLIKKNLKF